MRTSLAYAKKLNRTLASQYLFKRSLGLAIGSRTHRMRPKAVWLSEQQLNRYDLAKGLVC